MLKNYNDLMVLELVMASKRHLKPSIRGVRMMEKQWFFKVFKVLHDFDMKLYHVSRGENVEKQMVFQAKRCHNNKQLRMLAYLFVR